MFLCRLSTPVHNCLPPSQVLISIWVQAIPMTCLMSPLQIQPCLSYQKLELEPSKICGGDNSILLVVVERARSSLSAQQWQMDKQ